jgi:uncharacterized protein YijF (DUF1287 family)
MEDEEQKAKAAEEAKAAQEAADVEAARIAKAAEEAAADAAKQVTVTVTLETSFTMAKGDVKALKAATPDNKLATARLYGAKVRTTVKVS